MASKINVVELIDEMVASSGLLEKLTREEWCWGSGEVEDKCSSTFNSHYENEISLR